MIPTGVFGVVERLVRHLQQAVATMTIASGGTTQTHRQGKTLPLPRDHMVDKLPAQLLGSLDHLFGIHPRQDQQKLLPAPAAGQIVLAQAAGALSVSELAQQGVSSAVARALAQNGLADAVQKRVLRNSYNTVQERGESLQLTAEQKDLLYRAEGYAERDLYRAPWH